MKSHTLIHCQTLHHKLRKSLYLVRMREDIDQKNSEYGYFLCITITATEFGTFHIPFHATGVFLYTRWKHQKTSDFTLTKNL